MHIVEKRDVFSLTQCGKNGNLRSHFFGKTFVKATFVLRKLLNNWFDEPFFFPFWWVNFSFYHCVSHSLIKDSWIQLLSTICNKNVAFTEFCQVSAREEWKKQNFSLTKKVFSDEINTSKTWPTYSYERPRELRLITWSKTLLSRKFTRNCNFW